VKKAIVALVVLGAIGYVVYRQVSASQAEQDLWTEATLEPEDATTADSNGETGAEPDLR